MSYDLRQEGSSFLILAVDPEQATRAGAERLIAVCGNGDDAARVLAGLMLLDLPPATK